MTRTQHIAILGAGITGLCNAHTLAQAGHTITMFEPREIPPQNASYIAGGMLAPYSEIEHMDTGWIDCGISSIQIWRTFAKTHNIDFNQNGSLLISHKDDGCILERFEKNLPPTSYTKTATPEHLSKFQTGLLISSEAHLDPEKTMRALIEKTAFTHIQKQAAPAEIQNDFDTVIDCRGMGAQDDDPDIRGVKGELLIVHNPEFHLDQPLRLMHPRYPLYIVPRAGNIFMIGATNIESSENTNVSVRSGLELRSALYSLHPSFGDAEIIDIKAGIRPAYPNNLPRITIKDNMIRCNGLFRHGYLLAPIMAECVKEYISGKQHKFFDIMVIA